MIFAQKPKDESERLAALASYCILETPKEKEYDEIVQYASQACETPIALISLVSQDHQWFKAKVGIDIQSTPRDISFCSHAILDDQPLIVKNAKEDKRFFDNPFVTGDTNPVVFYCGIPLKTDQNHRLGTLCVIDHKPRELTAFQIQTLVFLAHQISKLLDLRLSQKHLSESSKIMDHFFSMGQDFLFTGEEDGFFKKISQSFMNHLGYEEKDLLEKPFISFVHPEDVKKTLSAMISLPNMANRSLKLQNRYKKKNNEYCHISWVITLNDTNCLCGIGRDVTDLTELNEALDAEKKRAEKAIQIKSRFVANMSHEIRTPLHGILGNVALLSDTILSTEQKNLLFTVKNCGNTLLALIDDVLDFSRIEAGKMLLQKQPVSFKSLCEDVKLMLLHQFNEKKLEFRIQWDPKIPSWIEGDLVRLRQVLLNLCSNGAKFTNVGFVELEVKSTEKKQNGQFFIEVTVTDTGIGMSQEQTASLFQDFYQVDMSSTRKYGGSGLGLVISRHLARLMEGDIWVESVLGHGSRFTFSFLTQETKGDLQRIKTTEVFGSQKEQSSKYKDLSILLVEDNRVNQELALRYLKKLGVQSALAENGKIAVELCQKQPFHIILMDIHMPEMDGHEATREIRKLSLSWPQPKIFALTASVLAEDQIQCQESGMDDFLKKPLKLEDLENILSKHSSSESLPEFNPDSAWEEILHIFDHDTELAKTIITAYLEELPQAMSDIKTHIHDLSSLKKSAHTLKGSSSNLSSSWVTKTCEELETAAKNNQPEPIGHLVIKLKKEVDIFSAMLKSKIEIENSRK